MKYATQIASLSLLTVVLAGSNTHNAATLPPNKRTAKTGTTRIVDLPLNRAIRGVIPLVPGLHTCSLGSGVGIAITEVGGPPQRVTQTCDFGRLRIMVDGVAVASVVLAMGAQGNTDRRFDPPIVVPPGSMLGLEWTSYASASSQEYPLSELSLAGWSLLPGDL